MHAAERRSSSRWETDMTRIGVVVVLLAASCHSHGPVWHDEFDGPQGASYDRTKWLPELGGDGFGNQERELYTDHDNAVLDGAGHLMITARATPPSDTRNCWYGRCLYT